MYHCLILLCLISTCLSLPSVTIIRETFTTKQTGDATYYGATTGGNCGYGALKPSWANSVTPIALNNYQYVGNDQSQGCGLCLSYTGTGSGSGASSSKPSTTTAVTAWVTDRCPECAKGSIDIGKSGDGRWGVSWKAVPCPVGSEPLYYKFEGSNLYYLKMQVIGHRIPINAVTFSFGSKTVTSTRSQDNFFVASPGGVTFPLKVTVTATNGESVTDTLTSVTSEAELGKNNVMRKGSVQFKGVSGIEEDSMSVVGGVNGVLMAVLLTVLFVVLVAIIVAVVLVYRRRPPVESV